MRDVLIVYHFDQTLQILEIKKCYLTKSRTVVRTCEVFTFDHLALQAFEMREVLLLYHFYQTL